jgi:hypothetical protein
VWLFPTRGAAGEAAVIVTDRGRAWDRHDRKRDSRRFPAGFALHRWTFSEPYASRAVNHPPSLSDEDLVEVRRLVIADRLEASSTEPQTFLLRRELDALLERIDAETDARICAGRLSA